MYNDVIPDKDMFAYKFLKEDLLSSLLKDEFFLPLTKRILRDALHGLSALHERSIVHTDIKAENFF